MNLYIDESGSINNQNPNGKVFIICIVHVLEKEKLHKAYKRFVSSNYDRLKELDRGKEHFKTGRILKSGGKMFNNGNFEELKGAQFDRDMKRKFLSFFAQSHLFDLYYVRVHNDRLKDSLCSNTACAFNYFIRLALQYFLKKGFLPDEDCFLHLDERNEKTRSRYFLQEYLNTELVGGGVATGKFIVQYFDSSNNKFIQIADVFSNALYSREQTGSYREEFRELRESEILKCIFDFPI